MIALVPVREGVLPAGADETIAECGGRVVLAGSAVAAVTLDGLATDVRRVELGPFAVARWTTALVTLITDLPDADEVVLPGSPDGRDLAPWLAAALGRQLLAGATTVTPAVVYVARGGGLELHKIRPDGPFVATLQPGVRGTEPFPGEPVVADCPVDFPEEPDAPTSDAVVVDVLPPDVRTMDLAEARHIVGGGAGLDSAERFTQLAQFARAIGGVMGATRVITDRGWVSHDHQIGTTGVVVDPTLYVSFGVSGAVQHTSGLGAPAHIISVNTEPHCPMMAMSDLPIVSDANETLDHLLDLLTAERAHLDQAGTS
jgi:electron transfer flavoprotein alpha subunit